MPWPFQRGVFRLEKLEFLFYESLDHREKSLISVFPIQGAFSLWNNRKMPDFFARTFKTIISLSRKPKIFWIKALLLVFLKGFLTAISIWASCGELLVEVVASKHDVWAQKYRKWKYSSTHVWWISIFVELVPIFQRKKIVNIFTTLPYFKSMNI